MDFWKMQDTQIVDMKGFDDNGVDEVTGEKQRIPFFGSMSKNKETTWVISLFVFVHLVVFFCTMIVNNCLSNSHGDCALMFFQPLHENPLLGPSSSALDRMGALRRIHLTNIHGVWRLFTSPLLHAGVFHLFISLSSAIYIGINLEQKYGPSRTGIIFILSVITGSLMATLFVQNRPDVSSSAALFGLIGASFSGLIRDWKSFSNKFQAVMALLLVFAVNFALGMLPFIDNFSNIAGFMAGSLLGYVLFFSPQLRKPALHKGLFDYGVKKSVALKDKLGRPTLRIVCLLLFLLMVAGLIVAALSSIDINKYCSWCHFVDCVPSKMWICDSKSSFCKTTELRGQMVIRCLQSDKLKILPYTGISATRLEELCSMICS
ncbi:RHOMBOID-like protein 8 [Chenopodium quinoa]|nr:RHOMBOID-like protein 8 [Chenopodium quinoa]